MVAAGFAARAKTFTNVGIGGGCTPIGSGGNKVSLDAVTTDQWYPQTGIGAGYDLCPASGVYNVNARVDIPHYTYGGIGFGNGYSGAGATGGIWVRHTRGGATVTDNIGLTTSSLPDAAVLNRFTINTNVSGVQKDDKLELWGCGEATGTGPIYWDALYTVTKLKA
jgi:hypothetical protein